jgi:hypothetical protein
MTPIKAQYKTIAGLATISEFGFTTAELAAAELATLCATANVKFLYDGSTPTSLFGLTLVADTLPAVEGGKNIRNLQFYGTGTVTILLERQ